MAKLFVGSLPFEFTEDQLLEMFNKVGQVASAKLITDHYTGRSKGFGFVEMSSEDEAQAAIQALNGSNVGGRTIIVNVARPMEKREDRGGGGFGVGRKGQRGGGGRKGGSGGGFNRW